MAQSLKTLQSKAIEVPKKGRKVATSAFDFSEWSGKMGTVRMRGTEKQTRVNYFGNVSGSGSPYVSVYVGTVDDRRALLQAGITITAEQCDRIEEMDNGKWRIIATLPALKDGQRPEAIKIANFPSKADAEKFVSVTVVATN